MARSYQLDSYQAIRENWLVRFLGVQAEADARLNTALASALDSVTASLGGLEGKPGVGAATRRAQLLGNQGVITRVMNVLYNKAGDIIRSGQSDAAGAAVEAELKSSRKILQVIEKDAAKRAVLERSLEQSARRNVQTMMTRILRTEQPLSKRIYNSKSIARGQVSRVINNHLAKGSSAEELSRDVRKFFDPKVAGGVNAAARRLARTEINNAFHAQSIADMQDRPWVNQVRWSLSKSHPAKQAYDKCDEYARIGLFAPEQVPKKPHPNCFPEGTVVSAKSVRAISKRWHNNGLVDIFLGEDSPQLSGTPNHPALTLRGWVPLSELHEGDYVAVDVSGMAMSVDTPGDNNVISSVEDIFKSFFMSSSMSSVRVPQSSEQFHGDGGSYGDVYIVGADSFLQDMRDLNHRRNVDFFVCDSGLIPLFSFGSSALLLERSGSTSGSFMRSSRHGLGVFEAEGRSSVTQRLIQEKHHLPDLGKTEADNVGSLLKRLSGSVYFQRIEGIIYRPRWEGHVYNLQTEEGWFLANSIAVHNCLCFVTPQLPDIETVINEYLAGNYNNWIAENMDDELRRSA